MIHFKKEDTIEKVNKGKESSTENRRTDLTYMYEAREVTGVMHDCKNNR